ncbi:sugar phosphate isomerase/epimerase [Thermosporothrix hazakensis]|jgi:sugar phosphate isomerase/epimerase|uniref:Sugar phosphate isomerase/epimerase n=2 Tax=Thermosporothrix TaxID=768650 RepID=A0A326UCC9_THEHA|nr:sugar phosphate isomerase/epimerase family protein [Thermosporothrix hazakensis]PZW31929.1 sugar phosphate isomerase/epimerase [Thermosporothrix hazakensis]BBH91601.1 xylose isomerase [Thermosporothrix sp. COM3]GCE49746.1 xylose isomerase [Thermosporothrix hazakensis]
MIRLSAFADEISADLEEQIAVLKQEGIHYIELRSVWNTNVLHLSDEQLATIKQRLEANNLHVAAIGSPIGKVPVTAPFEEHMYQFERALIVARRMETPYIRIFSFYPPENEHERYRSEILQRLRSLADRAQEQGITLLHENEKLIYGDTIARNVDLLSTLEHPHFRAVLDPANYLECKQVPFPDAYTAIKPWLAYVHVKDVTHDGTLVVAGEGEANWPALLEQLRTDGYDGFFALEPHLAAAGQYQGFSGAALFRKASQSFQHLLKTMHWEYR